MRRILLGALLLASVSACTFVNETPTRQTYPGYVQSAPPVYGVPRDSYEAERQIYEQGRRDGAAGRTGW